MSKIQIKTLTFNVVTKADEPLTIEPHVMDEIAAALDQAVRYRVDLRYGGKYEDKSHEYVGVMLP